MKPSAFHQRRWQDGRTLARTRLGRRDGADIRRTALSTFIAATCTRCWPMRSRASACISATAASGLRRDGDRVDVRFENGAAIDGRCPDWRRRHSFGDPPCAAWAGAPAVHRLHRLSRPDADRARRTPRHRHSLQQLDGSGPAFRLLPGVGRPPAQLRRACWSRTPGSRSPGPSAASVADLARRLCRVRHTGSRNHRRRRPHLQMGAARPRAARRAGRSAVSRCSATPATRCCHSSARAARRRSRTALR